MSNNISDITVTTINGEQKQLSQYAGKVLLIVNVASYCGYTSQYEGLEKLSQEYKDKGFCILAFPCNDFGTQEPGSNEEIMQFCTSKYNVTFEMFDKVQAKGSQQHPLYTRLTHAVEPVGDISWNFEKFVVNKQGEAIARFKSSVKPYSPELIATIESELVK
jgi:glutathione peroxidase